MTPSEKYLKPESMETAILQVSITPAGKYFVIETYDKIPPSPDNLNPGVTTPRQYNAATFVERRMKHGHKRVSRQGALHPIYHCPITDYTVSIVLDAWKGKRIISPAAQPFFNRIFLREFSAEQNANRAAAFFNSGTVPTTSWHTEHDAFLLSQGITLAPYQKVAAFSLTQSESFALLCEPGTGKTLMMLRKLDFVADRVVGRQSLTLILCPKSIRGNWETEASTYLRCKHSIIYLHGPSPTDRVINLMRELADVPPENHIVIIAGYEAYITTPALHELEFDLLLVDESHSFANPHTKRTKALLELSHKFANKVIATGTFLRNSPFDGYAQLELMGHGYSGFDSFKAFKDFYGVYAAHTNGAPASASVTGFKNIPLLKEKLAKHAFVITKKDALPHLPPIVFSTLGADISTEQRQVYYALCEKLTAEFEHRLSSSGEPEAVTVKNILTQMLRLAQVTSGYTVMDSGEEYAFDPCPKLDLLMNAIAGTTGRTVGESGPGKPTGSPDTDELESSAFAGLQPNEKAIVWCVFKPNVQRISEALTARNIRHVTLTGDTKDRTEVVTQYNCDRETKVFIGTTASGGVGLNLVGHDPYNPQDYDTNTVVSYNYSSNWSYVLREQSLNRAHRYNTRVPQRLVDLLVPRSIDMEIYSRLAAKKDMAMQVQNVREILRNLIPNLKSSL